jgi:hypothetical protein
LYPTFARSGRESSDSPESDPLVTPRDSPILRENSRSRSRQSPTWASRRSSSRRRCAARVHRPVRKHRRARGHERPGSSDDRTCVSASVKSRGVTGQWLSVVSVALGAKQRDFA